jgi:hypothetical protein
VGYYYLKREKLPFGGSGKTLNEQISIITLETLKRIKIFSLIIRFGIILLLFFLLLTNIYLSDFTIFQFLPLFVLLFLYLGMIFIFLRYTRSLDTLHTLNNNYDLIYVVLEICGVYGAILFFPTHAANVYSHPLKGLWFALIVLSPFTGQWYYGFISGGIVAILNSTFILKYRGVVEDFRNYGLDYTQIIPSFQIWVLSVYYFLTGALVSFPFYLFRKQQSLAFNIRIENIIAQPYFDLCLPDGDVTFGDYLVTKITSSNESIGADYVSVKQVRDTEAYRAMILGDTIGHGLNRSPGAIIAMAAFRGCYSDDPVFILHAINRALLPADKESGGNAICLCLLFKKGGEIELAGKAESVRILSPHKTGKITNEITTKGEILGITEHLDYTKLTRIYMNVDDILIIQTDGAAFNDSLDDKTVVIITRLKTGG